MLTFLPQSQLLSNTNIRNTEEAVLRPQYFPCLLYWPMLIGHMMAKGCIVAWVLPLTCFFFLLPNYMYIRVYAIIIFSHIDKRGVLQQENSQPPIPPSPHFQWVVKPPKKMSSHVWHVITPPSTPHRPLPISLSLSLFLLLSLIDFLRLPIMPDTYTDLLRTRRLSGHFR